MKLVLARCTGKRKGPLKRAFSFACTASQNKLHNNAQATKNPLGFRRAGFSKLR
jgi:hypothetical protein